MNIHISFKFNSSPFNYKSEDIKDILFNKRKLIKLFQRELSKSECNGIFHLKQIKIDTFENGHYTTDNVIISFNRVIDINNKFDIIISDVQRNIISKILEAQERVTYFREISYNDRCFLEELFTRLSNSLERTLAMRIRYRNKLVNILNNQFIKGVLNESI